MMKHLMKLWVGVGLMMTASAVVAADLPALWAERLAAVVAVEYTAETELDRRQALSFGVVADDEGLVVLPGAALNDRFAPDQLRDWRIYRPGSPVTAYSSGEYLGLDPYTGWHFVRIAPEGRAGLRPITDFVSPAEATREPRTAETVWGIGMRKKDEDFRPYFLQAAVSLVQEVPWRTAIALSEVAAPGLPVFDGNGYFVGLGVPGFGQSFMQFSRRARGGEPVVMVNGDEAAAFVVAGDVLPNLGRVPTSVFGRPLAWMGLNGVGPVDPEVAQFLELGDQAALVMSEVLVGGPAEAAGVQARDILLAVDGTQLPRLKPDGVVGAWLDREIARRAPGDKVSLLVLRNRERVELELTLGDAPKIPREAARSYRESLGFTVREFVYADAIGRRVPPSEARGAVVHFLKPNSPAATAGMQVDDWVQEIDGAMVADFAAVEEKLAAIEADTARNEFVLLVWRGGETAVLRVKLR